MPLGLKGENLVFLISQPRAGSTLLQRVLGSHPSIHTVSEPWLMLSPLNALRPCGYQDDYHARLARAATLDFLRGLPDGDEAYREGVRRMYSYLYERALEGSGKRYFLDKTPLYYLIIPELYQVFSDARYIILLRNPLAVLNSFLTRWIKGNWLGLNIHRRDLMWAPRLLRYGITLLGSQALVVHYEQLVADPLVESQKICAQLGLDFTPEMVEYGRAGLSHWLFGDEQEVYRQERPVPRFATRWMEELAHPQVWRFAHDYLNALGRNTVEQMGYSYDALAQVLEAHRPSSRRLWRTIPLAWALTPPIEQGMRKGTCDLVSSGTRRLAVALSRAGTKPFQ